MSAAQPEQRRFQPAAAVDLLCLCVLSDADVEQVLVEQGALAAMAPGSVIAVHSTTHPHH